MTATMNDDWNVKYNREGGAEGDIVFARIQHTATQVVMYMRYRQLSVPRQYASFQYTSRATTTKRRSSASRPATPKPQGQAFSGSTNWAPVRRVTPHQLRRRLGLGADRARLPEVSRSTSAFPPQLPSPLNDDSALKILYDTPARDGGTLNQVSNSVTPWVVTG